MESLRDYSKRKQSKYVECETYYTGLIEQIAILLNVKSNREAQNKLMNYMEVDSKLEEEKSKISLVESGQGSALCTINNSSYVNCYTMKNLQNRKLYFLEELRCIILLEIKVSNSKHTINVLNRMHMHLHMLQLYFTDSMTYFNKLNEFLNTNFKISGKEPIKNLLRGNLGEIAAIEPSLTSAIEEFISKTTGSIKPDIKQWAKKHEIKGTYYDIFANRYTDFNNTLEYCCYKLKYDRSFDIHSMKNECELLNTLLFGSIGGQDATYDSLKLVFALLNPSSIGHDIPQIRSLFERAFIEAENLGLLTALKFLIYSKHINIFYNVTTTAIDFSSFDKISELIQFGDSNRLDNQNLKTNYTKHLQDTREFKKLIWFLIRYPSLEFEYSDEAILYFVANFKVFADHIELPFLKSVDNLFIHSVATIQCATFETFEFVLKHRHFMLFSEQILVELCKTKNKKLMLVALNRLVDAETGGRVVRSSAKRMLLDELND